MRLNGDVGFSPATSATLIICYDPFGGLLMKLPAKSWRKARMRSSQHAPYILGDTRATMVETKRSLLVKVSKSQKLYLSSDCRLQLADMKSESLVIAGQPYGGEYVPGPCTHRPSLRQSRVHPKSMDS